MESTVAGRASDLFSPASAAPVTSAIMKPSRGAVLDQEGRQAALLGVREDGDAALRHAPISQGQRRLSAAKATGSAWKAAGEELVDDRPRMSLGGIRRDLERARDITDLVQRGPHHLRLAAEAIGVLQLPAVVVGARDAAALQQVPQFPRDGDLAGLSAGRVEPASKGRPCP